MTARYLTLTIPPELAGAEVNTLLRRHLHLSGTVLRRIKWLDDGITLNGERVTVRARVSTGQTLAVRLTCPARTSAVVPAPGPLDIVYEDGDIAVVSKAPGVLVHPGHGHYADTVGNFLLHRWQSRGEESDFHPVHRLDKGTSGLLVVAKHPHGQELLKRQLHTGRFVRRYLAVCDGCPHPPEGVVDAPLRLRPGSLMEQEIHLRARGPSPATGWWTPPAPARWWSWSWTPGAPTRSGCTWPIWAVPSPGTFSTGGRTGPASAAPPSTPPARNSTTPSPGRGCPSPCRCLRI